jgi:hypothetical protein
VNWSATLVALVPPGVATVTSNVPRVPVGDVAVMELGLFTLKFAAGAVPNFTALAPVKPVPVMVTDVPPVLGPEAGLMEVTVGGPGGGFEAMVTFWTWWMSLKPPVPPVKPTST